MSYFTGFDVIIKNELGINHRQGGLTVHVYNVTDSASLGTIGSGDFGVIESQSIAVAAGKVIEFSVTGYTGTLRRTTVASLDDIHFQGVTDLALLLEDNFTETPVAPAYNEIWVKTADKADPVKIGTAMPGETLKYPFNPAVDVGLQFFAIAKTEKGAADVFDLQSAAKFNYEPNRETGTPTFVQDGAATNTQINFLGAGYSIAKFRRVQYADDAGFTTNLVDFVQGSQNSELPSNFSIGRAAASGTKAVYVRIAHSTNSSIFGAWSETRAATFANSGGTGGSSASHPPTGLVGLRHGATVMLNWNNNGGASSNVIYLNDVVYDSVSASTDNYSVDIFDNGFYSWTVGNDDGKTDPYQFNY